MLYSDFPQDPASMSEWTIVGWFKTSTGDFNDNAV